MSACVYIILHSGSGKAYIGKTSNLKERWRRHVKESRKRTDHPLYAAIRSYGAESFTVSAVEEFSTDAEALEAEAWWIRYLKSIGASLYNLVDGGGSAWIASSELRSRVSALTKAAMADPSVRARISAGRTGKVGRVGFKHPAELRAHWSAIRKGRPVTEEARRKIGEAHKGRVFSAEHIAKIVAKTRGRKLTDEHRAKLSAAKLGKKRSPESLAKAAATRARNSTKLKTV